MKGRLRTPTARRFVRFLAFAAIIAVLFAYVSWRWESYVDVLARPVGLPATEGTPLGGGIVQAPQPARENAGEVRGPAGHGAPAANLRLARDRALSLRREALEQAQAVAVDPEERGRLGRELAGLASRAASELEIEALLRAKGYEEPVAFLADGGAFVFVGGRGLDRNDVARVADVVSATADLRPESIRVQVWAP